MRKMSLWLVLAVLLFQCQENELIAPADNLTTAVGETQSSVVITTANSFNVSVTGSDAGDGSVTKPWRTLRYAVSKVPANQGFIIVLSAGTFVESGLIEVPLGVSVVGAGVDKTILKAASSFYYYPASPAYATDKFLISLNEYNQRDGNQTLSGFTIDGDGKKLHGGIYVRYRNKVIIENVKVQNTNFTGIWLWDLKDSKLISTQIINSSWGSTAYCVGALNVGNLENVEIDRLDINEDRGYGIKAIGPNGNNNIINVKIHDSRVSVHPFGLWNGGSAPNIAIELWQVNLVRSEIYNTYVDNTISLINSNATPSTGIQTIRVHHNILDMMTRAGGAGYAVELTIHDAEVDNNYFLKGKYGIANWDNPMKNWNIHHNTFYGLENYYPGEIVRSQWSGLHNVKFYNNTVEFTGTKTMNVIGLYGGASDNVDIKNNLFINNNTGYSYYPNQLVHLENGATLSVLTVKNNLFDRLAIGTVAGTYGSNLTADPLITKTDARPSPYYMPKAGSPLINAGVNVGYTFAGTAPEIGALEYNSVSNMLPSVSITSPASNASFATGSTISISANATDADGTVSKVEFYAGTTLLGQDTSSPFSFNWTNVAAGTYSLTAKATDNTGATLVSSPVSIKVNAENNSPIVSLTNPLNNATFTAGSTVTLSATASDADGTIAKVEFYNGSVKLGEDIISPYSFSWANVPAGNYSLTARATDNANGVSTSAPIAIIVNAINKAPAISLTSPLSNATFTVGAIVTIAAAASDTDGTITRVEFYNGAIKLGEDITSPYSFSWANVVAGNYSLTARATDNAGATTVSIPVSITVVSVVNKTPVVSLTNPLNNSTFLSGTTLLLTATASDTDGTITKVEFYNGTIKIGEDLSSPFTLSWTPYTGTYVLSAKAIDNTGAVAASNAASIKVTGRQVSRKLRTELLRYK
jgi:hypothetical protein